MNEVWMREKLERLLQTCAEYERASAALPPGSYYDERTQKPIRVSIQEQLPTCRRIIEKLDPTLIPEDFGQPILYEGLSDTEEALRMALATLADRASWTENLSDDSPQLSADRLHPWVWGAAAQFWDAGQHSSAVETAAKSLTAHLQKVSGLATTDRELVTELFSPKAGRGTVRMWLPGDRSSATWASRQAGLHNLAIGAYAGIRNVVAHTVDPGWSEHEALEFLAVLSVVARWASESEIVTPN